MQQQKVFVINQHGQPLMPCTPRKARQLLKSGLADKVHRGPFFAIRLRHGSSGYKQDIHFGGDTGYGWFGYSARTDKEELVGGEVKLLSGIKERMDERRQYRRNRRSRLRYRKPRFDNRRMVAGWLAPSILHKLEAQIRVVTLLESLLPFTSKTIEGGAFDVQRLRNPGIVGVQYQLGPLAGFWNVREYVLHRDNHECQHPDCKTQNRGRGKPLQVHHVGFWYGDYSDREENLVTLCLRCHQPREHLPGGKLHGWKPKRKGFREAAFMTLIYRRIVDRTGAVATFGYITKSRRIALGLEKSHHNDAFVISGGTDQERCRPTNIEQIRRNNRSLEDFHDAVYRDKRDGSKKKGKELDSGRRSRNHKLDVDNLRCFRAHKLRKGSHNIRHQRYPYQVSDLVEYQGKRYIVAGTHNKGSHLRLRGHDKSVRVELVRPVRSRKGLCCVV